MMYCYRVVATKDPEKYGVGKILLLETDEGQEWKPERLRMGEKGPEFEQYMRCRFLGRVHARTTRGKVLAVNHLLRSAGYKRGFLPVPKAVRA